MSDITITGARGQHNGQQMVDYRRFNREASKERERERERGGKKKDEKKEEKMFLFFWPPTAGPCERYSVEKQTKPG